MGSGPIHVVNVVRLVTVPESRNGGSFHRGGQCGSGFVPLWIVCGLDILPYFQAGDSYVAEA